MILLTFRNGTSYRLGVRHEAGVFDVKKAVDALGDLRIPTDIDAVVNGGLEAVERLAAFEQACQSEAKYQDWLHPESSLTLGPCVPSTGKIMCVGLNYRRHAAEAGLPVPSTPIIFAKYENSHAIHQEEVPLPPTAKEYDYEAELVVVIGKEGKYIPKDEALSYVLGYANGNDISARDLQARTSQWLLGKTLDKFMPIGPYLVTHHEISDPQELDIKCWFNGELRQNSNTRDMIFSVAEVIHYASQYFTLSPGDILTTGTPEGVIFGDKDPRWMKPGDEVVIEIEKLGRLVNTMTHDPQSIKEAAI